MKRSEMLSELEYEIRDTEDLTLKCRAEHILNILEKAGMLPPPKKLIDCDSFEKGEYWRSYIWDGYYNDNDNTVLWEPESNEGED